MREGVLVTPITPSGCSRNSGGGGVCVSTVVFLTTVVALSAALVAPLLFISVCPRRGIRLSLAPSTQPRTEICRLRQGEAVERFRRPRSGGTTPSGAWLFLSRVPDSLF